MVTAEVVEPSVLNSLNHWEAKTLLGELHVAREIVELGQTVS